MAPEKSETTLRRGMSLLFMLGSDESLERGGLGVVRIAELAGMEKSQVSRTLKTLETCGLLSRDPATLLYRLSWQLFTLAARAGDHHLVEAAPQILDHLVVTLQESAFVSVLRGSEVLTVAAKNGDRIIGASVTVGQATPAYCSSSGRALLMDHTPAQMTALFKNVEFHSLASRTPKNVKEMIARVQAASIDGVAIADEESEPSLIGIAAPIRDARNRIVAAINVSGPSFRLAPITAAAVNEVAQSATKLSSMLGASPGLDS